MGQILQQLVLDVLIGNSSILLKENTLGIPRWGKYYNNPFNIHARLPSLYRVPITLYYILYNMPIIRCRSQQRDHIGTNSGTSCHPGTVGPI